MGIILRERKLKGGAISFYLDISHEGERNYEFLGIKIKPGKGRKLSEEDKLKKAAAEKIRSQREYELLVNGKGLPNEMKGRESMLAFMEAFDKEKDQAPVNGAYRHLKVFLADAPNFQINKVDREFVLKFQKFLLGRVSHNTSRTYIIGLCMALNQAVEDKIIKQNPINDIKRKDRLKKKVVSRDFLTIEELRKLAQTQSVILLEYRHAFLFSCFTGLRYSDLHKLRWNQIRMMGEGKKAQWVLDYQMKKGERPEFLPLTSEIMNIVDQRRKMQKSAPSDYIFPLLVKENGEKAKSRHPALNKALKVWAKEAGIEKRLHIHAARHTFATLGISSGVDLYVMSKLLGHKEMTTTQIYAKVVDSAKHRAVNLLPSLGGLVVEESPKQKPGKKKRGNKTASKAKGG